MKIIHHWRPMPEGVKMVNSTRAPKGYRALTAAFYTNEQFMLHDVVDGAVKARQFTLDQMLIFRAADDSWRAIAVRAEIRPPQVAPDKEPHSVYNTKSSNAAP